MSDDTIATWFAPHGPIARLLPGYETRPGQIDLAEGLTEALALHQPFLGEAGPGIGKSIAYLLAVLRSGQRAVVATHTKALQDQLYHKDLPLVERLIPGISTALLKGRQNYLCLLEFDHLQDEADQGVLSFATRDTGTAYQRLKAWVASGEAEAATGDLGALDVTLPDDLRRQVTVDSRDCLGRTCGFFERCYSQQAKAKAQEADLVVVNHALLLFDLVLGEQTAGGASLLPPAPVLVIDEAHHLPDVATEVFGAELTGGRWRAIESRLDRLEKPLLLTLAQAPALLRQLDAARTVAGEVRAQAEAWLETLLEALGKAPAKALEAVLDDAGRTDGQAVLAATEALADTIVALSKALAPATSEEAALRWQKLGGQIDRLATALAWALSPDDPDDLPLVRSVERQDGRRAARAVLRVRPLRVDQTLRRLLWTPRQGLAVSATLAVGTGPTAFDYWRGRVGVEGGVTRVIPSPFPFRTHARLYVPADGAAFDPSLPAHKAGDGQEAYRSRLLATIEDLLAVRRGGAFCLFTSYAMLRYVHERLQDAQNGRLLQQGEAPPAALIRRFKADGHAVLLGTRTFWEGVDVPGDALSLVIIDRLPFAVPDDPLWAARVRAAGDRWFQDLALPQTLMTLKQAFGRLLRRMDDRGVCAILDGRLRSKSYGRTLVQGLPPATLVDSVADVAAFFQEAMPP
jgi:ATP-dependent DNA helicase DinG